MALAWYINLKEEISCIKRRGKNVTSNQKNRRQPFQIHRKLNQASTHRGNLLSRGCLKVTHTTLFYPTANFLKNNWKVFTPNLFPKRGFSLNPASLIGSRNSIGFLIPGYRFPKPVQHLGEAVTKTVQRGLANSWGNRLRNLPYIYI